MAEKIQKFSVGQKVKLKNYNLYGDYISHKNQVAEIAEILGSSSMGELLIQVRWTDGRTSAIALDNLILAIGDWDD